MSLDDMREDGPRDPPECTTTTSFIDHNIDDGSTLIHRTYYRLVNAGIPEFEPTDEFFDSLETAFVGTYIGVTGEPDVPPHVRAALDDAIAWTRVQFEGRADVDLRTELLPRFYSELAGFHCSYRPHDGSFVES